MILARFPPLHDYPGIVPHSACKRHPGRSLSPFRVFRGIDPPVVRGVAALRNLLANPGLRALLQEPPEGDPMTRLDAFCRWLMRYILAELIRQPGYNEIQYP